MSENASIEFEEWVQETPDNLSAEYMRIRESLSVPFEASDLLDELVRVFNEEGLDAFAHQIADHQEILSQACRLFPGFSEALVLLLRLGISYKSRACAINLGAMYYVGEIVDADLPKACALRLLADTFQ